MHDDTTAGDANLVTAAGLYDLCWCDDMRYQCDLPDMASFRVYVGRVTVRGVYPQVAESGLSRPRAAAGANFWRRGMGQFPRTCKLRGPSGVTVGSTYISCFRHFCSIR